MDWTLAIPEANLSNAFQRNFFNYSTISVQGIYVNDWCIIMMFN